MIGTVTAFLEELGLLRSGARPRFHCGITRGDTLWLDAFVDGATFVHVKVSDVIGLADEARVYADAYAVHGGFLPRPYGHAVRDGWDLFACEGIEHRAIAVQDLPGGTSGRVVAQALPRLLAPARSGSGEPGPSPWLARLEEAYGGSAFDGVLAPWRAPAQRERLARLPRVAQHGDFVLNNLGVARGRLVVFDWEDYGKVDLPGFDLSTLLASAVDPADPAAGVTLAGRGPVAARWRPVVTPACAALGFTADEFYRLVPLHLLAFLQLKTNYARAVHDRVAGLLERLCAAPAPRGFA